MKRRSCLVDLRLSWRLRSSSEFGTEIGTQPSDLCTVTPLGKWCLIGRCTMGMNLFCEKYTVAWRGPVLWISNEQLYATRFISILLYLLIFFFKVKTCDQFPTCYSAIMFKCSTLFIFLFFF